MHLTIHTSLNLHPLMAIIQQILGSSHTMMSES